MKSVKIVCLLVLMCAAALPLHASSSDKTTGMQLVQQLFSDMKAGSIGPIETMMPEGFQSIHQDGARTRSEEIALMNNLHMGSISINDVVTTRSGKVLVVTYTVAALETIDGEKLSKSPAPRMSVFQETAHGWLWIAHANLRSVLIQ